jgi:hypothetical protein
MNARTPHIVHSFFLSKEYDTKGIVEDSGIVGRWTSSFIVGRWTSSFIVG